MNLITIDAAISHGARKRGARGPAGIYGLVDEREPNRVRYVGSSDDISHRLYSHWQSTTITGRTPRARWIRNVRDAGGRIAAVVLVDGYPGPPQSAKRHLVESECIARLHVGGQADLNIALTPVGHANSRDTRGKLLLAENKRLRRTLLDENQRLREELESLKAEFAAYLAGAAW